MRTDPTWPPCRIRLDDNDVPFSRARHLGTGAPDDNEMIVIDVGRDLYGEGFSGRATIS